MSMQTDADAGLARRQQLTMQREDDILTMAIMKQDCSSLQVDYQQRWLDELETIANQVIDDDSVIAHAIQRYLLIENLPIPVLYRILATIGSRTTLAPSLVNYPSTPTRSVHEFVIHVPGIYY